MYMYHVGQSVHMQHTNTEYYIGQVRHIYHVHELKNSVTYVYRVHALYWAICTQNVMSMHDDGQSLHRRHVHVLFW